MFHHAPSGRPRSRAYLLTVHIVFGLLLAATLALVFGYAVMLLWNAVLPDVLGTSRIGYWQAVGLLLLARILAGGLGHGKAAHGAHRQGVDARKAYDAWWKDVGEKSFRQYSREDRGESEPGAQ
ncbi:hypothetical protein [Solidesulfovibrio sp.]|uniref:hypothetical protein n=1 Tax=Solidesulfovibrio sp. TaxID=2910990 RepID=UPI002618D9C2|nr:hypothetical protein [Solidesulfovibrio sp.]